MLSCLLLPKLKPDGLLWPSACCELKPTPDDTAADSEPKPKPDDCEAAFPKPKPDDLVDLVDLVVAASSDLELKLKPAFGTNFVETGFACLKSTRKREYSVS